MPTYEYRCSNCRQLVEAFQRITDEPLVTCPHCGENGLQRIVSGGAGVLYKGEGWYVTDYSKKSSGGKDIREEKKASPTKTSSTKSGTANSDASRSESASSAASSNSDSSASSTGNSGEASKPSSASPAKKE